jgi:fibronectin type III domain protein
MNKNGVIAVVVVVVAIVLAGLWALRSGEGGVSGPDCAAAPSAPQGVAYSVAEGMVTIRWSPAAAGERVATYLVEAKAPQDVTPTTFVAPGNATTFQRQAPPQTMYYVNVLARNACGTSAPSSQLVVTVP